MEFPYCIVDGVEYQLVYSETGTLRFPKTQEDCDDLNKLISSYTNGRIDLSVVWDEYTKTGSSYSMVKGIFSPYGTNNHTVTQGKGKCKVMILHTGDSKIDEQYNESEDDIIYYDLENRFDDIIENYEDKSNQEIIDSLNECINKIKNRKQ